MAVETITRRLHFPYDAPPLTSNQRLNRYDQADRVRMVRSDAMTLARAAKLPRGAEWLSVSLFFIPPDRRRRDADNLVPTLKAMCDGLAAGTKKYPGYGVVADDTPDLMEKQMPVILAPQSARPKSGRLYLELVIQHEPRVYKTAINARPAVRGVPNQWKRKGIL